MIALPGIAIPYGAYWSSPFAKWQGALSHLHSVEFAAATAKRALMLRHIDPSMIDFGVLGLTVPQKGAFYGLPWLMGQIGAGHVGGPTINQACATGLRSLFAGASEVASGCAECAIVVATDRTSNGPHLYYPAPRASGGTGSHENWVVDNFNNDPSTGRSMIDTAENVARRYGITTAEQHDVVLRRFDQYQDALSDGQAFQKRYMELPFAVPDQKFARTATMLEGDEGIHQTTASALAKLKPVLDGGSVTFGGQTHPADGTAGAIVTTADRAKELSADRSTIVRLISFGLARVEAAHMPEAPVPAARKALKHAGLDIHDMSAIKSHNPFAVNDIVFARAFGIDVHRMNNYGSSLIWGHPQGPTGLRGTIELIEELVNIGGGYGLFQGCAAGDTAMAMVIKVEDGR
jgi:acetyl-CoA acetyltransferase family protein